MKLERVSPDRIEISDSGAGFTRYLRYFLIAVVLVVVTGSLFNGNIMPILLVLVAAGLFWKLADHVNVDSQAAFDRQAARFYLNQTRGGKPVAQLDEAVDRIENVIIEAAHRSRTSDETVTTRPALVIGGETVPLTFASFKSGPQASEIAQALRQFLSLPETDLIDDSIRQALAGPAGTGPAVRLARFGKGMGRIDAARYVQSVIKQASAPEPAASGRTHSIRRENP